LVWGLQSMVRGYDLRHFEMGECGLGATRCSLLEELTGSRFAVANVELRAPLKGLFTGELEYGRVPVELFAFGDVGFLWTRYGERPLERDRFRSVGLGGRVNLGGMILEV